jgi:transposase
MVHGNQKYKKTYPVLVFAMLKKGMKRKEIAGELAVSEGTLAVWYRSKKGFRKSVIRGRQAYAAAQKEKHAVLAKSFSFADYVYGKLPAKLQKLMNDINEIDHANSGIEIVEALLVGKGKRVRQQLFISALVSSNFSISKALQKVGVSHTLFTSWTAADPGFAELLKEIKWHRQNFCEEALMIKVQEGDTSAILFANKTVNRSRGYGDKTEVSGGDDSSFDIDKLNIPLETKRIVLRAIREKQSLPIKAIESTVLESTAIPQDSNTNAE